MTLMEEQALAAFIKQSQSKLDDNLLEIWLFGSTARNDRWKAAQQMRSDIDILVITCGELIEMDRQFLVDATYPLFLMCGSTISPQFRSIDWMRSPPDLKAQSFIEHLKTDALGLFPETIRNQCFQSGSSAAFNH